MRRSLRFLDSCSSSSLIDVSIQAEEIPLHAAQNHAFQSVEIVEAIAAGLVHGSQERLSWIFAHHAAQLPQGQHHQFAAALFESGSVDSDLRHSLKNGLFFGVRRVALEPLPAWRPVGGERDALKLLVGNTL